jgi:hypothetical protein
VSGKTTTRRGKVCWGILLARRHFVRGMYPTNNGGGRERKRMRMIRIVGGPLGEMGIARLFHHGRQLIRQ